MNIFVVAVGREAPVDAAHLEAALRQAAGWVPALGSEPIRVTLSRSGRSGIASSCHAPPIAGSRDYRSDTGDDVVLWDGMPVLTDGSPPGGARALVLRLARTTDGIEGMFATVRLDLVEDVAEIHNDPLGNLAVFELTADDGTQYVSNSLAVMAALGGRVEIDPVGASTFLTLGWYADGHTALRGVRVLAGGTRLVLASGRPPARRRYFSEALLAGGLLDTPGLTTVRDEAMGQLRSAASYGSPLRLGLTAGQDSLVCLALALAADVDVELYTDGAPGDADVDVAAAVARHLGLPHEVIPRVRRPSIGIETVVENFVGLSDASSSFSQFEDHFAQLAAGHPLSIKVLGLGGEVARTSAHPIRGFLASGPPIVHLRSVQLRGLAQKISLGGGLVRAGAREIVIGALNHWFDERRAEGWPTRWLAETLYVFDALTRNHQGSHRRTVSTSELVAPLSSRAFVTHAFSLTPWQRYQPGIMRGLIAASTPSLLDVTVQNSFQRSRPALAPLRSTKALLELAWTRRDGEASGYGQPISEGSWAEQTSLHLALVESASNSPMFSLIDRDVLIDTLRGNRPLTPGSLRALALVWWFELVAPGAARAAFA